jgi:hypothetical protein
MSARLAAAVAILQGDNAGAGNLVGLATGGIYDRSAIGRLGLNRNNPLTANAFDGNKNIKPCIVARIRSAVPVAEGFAVEGQREVLWLWFYDFNGYAAITSMRARVYVLLQDKRVGGITCRHTLTGDQTQDIDLDACVQAEDYAIWSLKTGA